MIAKIAPILEQFCAGVLDTVSKAHEALTKRLAAAEDRLDGVTAARAVADKATAEELDALRKGMTEAAEAADAADAAHKIDITALRSETQEAIGAVDGKLVKLCEDVARDVGEAKAAAAMTVGELQRAVTKDVGELREAARASAEALCEQLAQLSASVGTQIEALREAMAEHVAEVLRDRLAAFPTAEQVAALVPTAEQVAALVPRPADGKSVAREDVQAMVEEVARGFALPTAESIAEALDAKHVARWALDFERRAQDVLQRAVDRMPKPRDGEDGLGFDDIEFEYDGKRTWTIAVQRGERRKAQSFKVPAMLYQKIFSETALYDQGDVVTWAGSAWVALKDAPQGTPGRSHDWQLLVKKGRDGSNSAK